MPSNNVFSIFFNNNNKKITNGYKHIMFFYKKIINGYKQIHPYINGNIE